MLQPKTSSASSTEAKTGVAPTPVEDSDEQGEEDSSSSSSSDSSNPSDDECATPTTSSIMVMKNVVACDSNVLEGPAKSTKRGVALT